MNNTFVIGDVHGHYDALMKLVKKLPSGAKFVFVGALIDRDSLDMDVKLILQRRRLRS